MAPMRPAKTLAALSRTLAVSCRRGSNAVDSPSTVNAGPSSSHGTDHAMQEYASIAWQERGPTWSLLKRDSGRNAATVIPHRRQKTFISKQNSASQTLQRAASGIIALDRSRHLKQAQDPNALRECKLNSCKLCSMSSVSPGAWFWGLGPRSRNRGDRFAVLPVALQGSLDGCCYGPTLTVVSAPNMYQ